MGRLPLFQQTEMPDFGKRCTIDELAEWICDQARQCPHAARCAAQPVGGDPLCFVAVEREETIRTCLGVPKEFLGA